MRVRASSASCRNAIPATKDSALGMSDGWISSAIGDGQHRGTSSARLLTRSDRPASRILGSDRQGRRGSSGAVAARLVRPPTHPCRLRLVRSCSAPHTLGEEGWASSPAQGSGGNLQRTNELPAAIREWAGTSAAKMPATRGRVRSAVQSALSILHCRFFLPTT